MTTTEHLTTKAIILKALETLADDAGLDDALEHIVFVHTLQRRLERIDDEPTYTLEEIEQEMAEWHESS